MPVLVALKIWLIFQLLPNLENEAYFIIQVIVKHQSHDVTVYGLQILYKLYKQ